MSKGPTRSLSTDGARSRKGGPRFRRGPISFFGPVDRSDLLTEAASALALNVVPAFGPLGRRLSYQ
jgi:hypothetical protein